DKVLDGKIDFIISSVFIQELHEYAHNDDTIILTSKVSTYKNTDDHKLVQECSKRTIECKRAIIIRKYYLLGPPKFCQNKITQYNYTNNIKCPKIKSRGDEFIGSLIKFNKKEK